MSIRTTVRILKTMDRVAPGLAARVAEQIFCTPGRAPFSPRSRTFLAGARQDRVKLGGDRLATYTWGHGPRVYLLHGWAGRSSQWFAFVPALVDAGYQVIALDAVAHGQSEGRLSSLVQFRDSLKAVVGRYGPAHGVVAHSMGGAATALALADGLTAGRVVMLAPPRTPKAYLGEFAARTGLSRATMRKMKHRIAERLEVDWDDLDVTSVARRLSVPLTVFHDRDDQDVHWQSGAAIADAWPEARLVLTEGLGHTHILRDPTVIAEAVRFLGAEVPHCETCDRALREGTLCMHCELHEELFSPATRA